MKWGVLVLAFACALVAVSATLTVGPAYADALAIGSEGAPWADVSDVSDALEATGVLGTVDSVNCRFAAPSLADLSTYESVFFWTNYSPADATALGNVLADYVDAGGHFVMATFSWSTPWAVGGDITATGYSPLTDSGTNGTVSGSLVATIPDDPIFSGVDVGSLTYYQNVYYAHPGVDAGATLLATDGAGHNMIARNAAGNVLAINIWPGHETDNSVFLDLVANMLLDGTGGDPVPEPTTLALLGLGVVGWGAVRRRRLTHAHG